MISEEKELSELEFFKREDDWPRWPLLPVKNRERMREQDGGSPRFGIVYAGNPYTVFVDVNLWGKGLGERLEKATKEVFSSWEELIEAGWVGD